MLLPFMAWTLLRFHNCKVETLLTKLCNQFQPQHNRNDTMSEVIPCESHSQNTRQSPSLGIVLVTLPLFPMAKQNWPKSRMTTFTQRKRGIKNEKIHDDKQKEINPSVFLAILRETTNHLYMKNVIEDHFFRKLVMPIIIKTIINSNFYTSY